LQRIARALDVSIAELLGEAAALPSYRAVPASERTRAAHALARELTFGG
jgi:hypothetical protein